MLKPIRFIVVAIAIILAVILLDAYGYSVLSANIELFVVPIITVFYFLKSKIKNKKLLLFLVLYSISDLISIFLYDQDINMYYYICNLTYIAAYFFLTLYIAESLDFRLVFKRFIFDFTVLLLLDVYMLYVLINIVEPIDFESKYDTIIQVIEFLYSLFLIIIMSLSFLNYVQNVVKRNLYLFIACILIAFSELILIGYYFIIEDARLNQISITFYIAGMIMLCYHSLFENFKKERKLT